MKENYFYEQYYLCLSKVIGILILLFISSCVNPEDNYVKDSYETNKPVTEIYDVKVELPKAYGVELVEANCVPCHSLRYIEMQPDMNKKSWEKIVTKMIKNFGAPIKDTLISNQIVEYLVAVKGK